MTAVFEVIGISPLDRPDPGLVAAACDAGALGVLDLGRDLAEAERALAALARRLPGGFGVRVPEGASAPELPPQVHTVIVESVADLARFADHRVYVQVTSEAEARAAIAARAAGVIAKGHEAGGRVGEETTFVLVQRLVAALDVPVWAQGGIGLHTAAACIAGGAAGVVLDTQLALVRESSLAAPIKSAIAAMDGSETTVLAGYRVFTRPDLPVAQMPRAAAAEVRALLGGDDLHRNLVPVGQDGALARALAQHFPTCAALIRGVRSAIETHLADAVAYAPLGPRSPFAAAHGVKYPIAQGPMSRVSDRARFAEAVASGGGLPFLALTLMTGSEVRELLRETRELLGDRPWGVGILGFVPPDVREQQLEVLRELPPPVALIAGGRPSQAHPLEAQGTATYLHVPSPGLLELFLKDGARKFVFEGRECGGHVGPRSSFALWEVQLERLLAHPEPSELHVLFAGGIHDARSAAMVATMAAPLAARGAKIGVLMGTAYLFTDEAVLCGAIQPGFQQAAIACDRTVLVETAPGHSTRCADTEFTNAFADERARLEAAGATPQEIWASLEQLNLGRLRIAAKGLRRNGDVIAPVDAEIQAREGMFMIGQVAALRRDTCSVLDLHRDVSVGGTARVHQVAEARDRDELAGGRGTDVAIIGVAAIFPGAPDTDAFWANIVAGKNAIREVPPERWSVETYYDPAAVGVDAGKKTPCKWGGFLDDVPFDPLAYGIPPKSLNAIEPVQLLSLEIARRAIADAGYANRPFDRARTSVIFGAEAGTDLSSAYSFRALFPHYVGPLPAGLDESLPTLSEDSFPGVLSNVIAGRIANRLDLGGVNYTVDAACAASLAALDMAVKELVAGSSDMVLCGGADLHNSINDYLMFSSVHALSPTGQCHTFDAAADGIVLGEGVACIVVKRLADAERDGDRVYAVIKGVAGASDGKSLGLTAPRKDGQVRALDRAYRQAGVSPADVGLVEAHGTGTVVGDRTELQTLTEVYTNAGAEIGACVLGSVKSQIGHTKCAAGMAGLIKAALSIHHGVLPPTLNIKKPNPAWDGDSSPFVFLDQARPWATEKRVAAVSAFGFGGTNFHAVLTAHRGGGDELPATGAWPAELVLLRGTDRAAALVIGSKLEQRIGDDVNPPRLRDLARTACVSGTGPVQVAIVADSIADLAAKLALARQGTADRRGVWFAAPIEGKLAILCPGQGSQRPGMLADLFVAFPRLHRLLELGAPWAGTLYPPAAFTRDDKAAQAAALTDTRVAQPALGIADLAVAEILALCGVRPAMAAGHSYGELVALCLAGAYSQADLLALSAARGEAILDAAGSDPGAMAAVAADAAVVAPLVAEIDGLVIANHNSPAQCVLSGGTAAIDMALVLVAAAGLSARKLPVACAFHSPIVAGARTTLGHRLLDIESYAPAFPVYSNVTAAPYPARAEAVRELLAEQVASPVRFADEIRAMYDAGARVFVEAGPGQVLTKLVGEILGDRPHVAVACDVGDAGLRQLMRAFATLAAAGVAVDPAPLFWDRDAAVLDLDTPPVVAKGPRWLVNGHSARPEGETLHAAERQPMVAVRSEVPAMRSSGRPSSSTIVPGGEREGVVVEYLRGMREMIAAQRDVMLSYLGAVPARALEVIELPSLATSPARVVDVPLPQPVPQTPAVLDPMQLVLSIVSERTGYPIDTLGVDLDLEADLSIDSIKRIEIIGELAQRLGLKVDGDSNADAIVEELATRKTLRALVAWLSERLAQPAAGAPTPITSTIDAAAPIATADDADTGPIRTGATTVAQVGRYRLAIVPAPAPVNGYSTLAGQRIAICGGADDVAIALEAKLFAEGATVRRVASNVALGDELDGLVYLGRIDSIAAMRAQFERVREAALAGAKTIIVVTAHGGFGQQAGEVLGGPAGLVKTVAAEFPAIRARVVDVEPGAADVAELVHAELHAHDAHFEIGYVAGERVTRELQPAPRELGPQSAFDRTAPPSGGADARRQAPVLDAQSVVLVTGGARGITARTAIALAERYGCRIELVGRSPLPGVEPTELAAAADAPALRRALAGGGATPAEIEKQCARILADREIRATLTALGERGTYHAVDVRTPQFAALVDELYRTRGRIDGAIHGAGVLDDKLMKHKTGDAFERVYATKVAGARTLADKLRPDTKLVVLFSSIVGAFGNRGQADYAAAGDALDKLAWSLARKVSGRVVSIDWGPWAGAGMVSPELAREYARRGVDLIDTEAGVAAVLDEILAVGEPQVILSAADPRALWSRPATARPTPVPVVESPAEN